MGWEAAGYEVADGVVAAEEISTAIIENEALYNEVKAFINEPYAGWASTSNADVNDMMINGEEFVLLDVRRADEYEAGFVDPAVNIPLEELMSRMDEVDSGAKVVVYCKSGIRSLIATLALRMNGFADAYSMSGGYLGWKAAGFPVVGEAPDFKAIFANVIANNGQDVGYGTISVDALNTEMIENEDLVVIDVREVAELEETGHVPGAVNIPVKSIVDDMTLLPADLDTPILAYCKSGTRSTFDGFAIDAIGYTHARNTVGGF